MENLLTVKQLAAKSPAMTEGGIRHLLFHNIDNFRSRCAIKIGAKVVLDADAVAEWLEDHRGGE